MNKKQGDNLQKEQAQKYSISFHNVLVCFRESNKPDIQPQSAILMKIRKARKPFLVTEKSVN